MAATSQLYNHTISRSITGVNQFGTRTYKALLLLYPTPNMAHTDLGQVEIAGNYVWGNGWPLTGVVLTNITLTGLGTSGAKLIADDISVPITENALGPYTHILVYDDTDTYTKHPLLMISLGKEVTVAPGNNVEITWDDMGIIAWVAG